jgi:tetratricopeptide (TPR) repeat protein
MASKLLPSMFAFLCVLVAGHSTQAGDNVALAKELLKLNQMTGNVPVAAAVQRLNDDSKLAKALIAHALPAAKKKELSYNAAFVLGRVAGDMKNAKDAEVFLRICMDQAAKLQSAEKLRESYLEAIAMYFDNKKYADAARICRDLLELNTDDGKDRMVVPVAADRNGIVDFGEPRDSFDTAERLRPEVREIYIKATAKQGKFDQAMRMVDDILKKNDDWIDRQLKGWVYQEAGKFDDAVKIYEDVIREASKDDRFTKEARARFDEKFRYDISNVYIEMKKIDMASQHLEYLLKKHPENPGYYNDLGYVWADNDMKLDESEKLILKALDLDRERRKKSAKFDPKTDHDSGAYLDSLGWVLFKKKQVKEAKEWLLKAIEDKRAQHLEIYDHLGDVHLALGERDLAIKAWEKGLEFTSDSRRDLERKAVVEKKLEKAKASK